MGRIAIIQGHPDPVGSHFCATRGDAGRRTWLGQLGAPGREGR